jgi:hypothetical protein
MSLQLLYEGIQTLYETGNLSRADFSEAYGYEFIDQQRKRAEEKEVIDELGVDEFAPVPHSNVPGADGKNKGRPKKPPESKGKSTKKK